MLPESIIYLSIPISFIAYFYYFRDIIYGQTRPNLVSWTIWMLAPFIGIFFQLKAGATLSALPVFLAGFGPLIIIIVSLYKKNTFWKLNQLDIFCGILALMALVLYMLTHNLTISIIFAILSDAFAFIPTYIKSWKFPETETPSIYYASIFTNTLGLLIIKNWSFTVYSFGIYLIIANIIMTVILYRKRILAIF